MSSTREQARRLLLPQSRTLCPSITSPGFPPHGTPHPGPARRPPPHAGGTRRVRPHLALPRRRAFASLRHSHAALNTIGSCYCWCVFSSQPNFPRNPPARVRGMCARRSAQLDPANGMARDGYTRRQRRYDCQHRNSKYRNDISLRELPSQGCPGVVMRTDPIVRGCMRVRSVAVYSLSEQRERESPLSQGATLVAKQSLPYSLLANTTIFVFLYFFTSLFFGRRFIFPSCQYDKVQRTTSRLR